MLLHGFTLKYDPSDPKERKHIVVGLDFIILYYLVDGLGPTLLMRIILDFSYDSIYDSFLEIILLGEDYRCVIVPAS